VKKVHGRLSAVAGSKASARNTPSEVKTVSSSNNTTAFAMMSRVTHGVIRGWEIACIPACLSYYQVLPGLPVTNRRATDPIAQLGETDPHRKCRLRQQAGRGHAGKGVHL
jgi:hypothetical protein